MVSHNKLLNPKQNKDKSDYHVFSKFEGERGRERENTKKRDLEEKRQEYIEMYLLCNCTEDKHSIIAHWASATEEQKQHVKGFLSNWSALAPLVEGKHFDLCQEHQEQQGHSGLSGPAEEETEEERLTFRLSLRSNDKNRHEDEYGGLCYYPSRRIFVIDSDWTPRDSCTCRARNMKPLLQVQMSSC